MIVYSSNTFLVLKSNNASVDNLSIAVISVRLYEETKVKVERAWLSCSHLTVIVSSSRLAVRCRVEVASDHVVNSCYTAPQSQQGNISPQRDRQEFLRRNPVLRRFRAVHPLRVRSALRGRLDASTIPHLAWRDLAVAGVL